MEALSRGEIVIGLMAATSVFSELLENALNPEGVSRVRLWRLAVPLVHAVAAAHGTETVRHSVVVELTRRSGATGWGECVALAAPTYSAEWAEGAWLALCEQLVPAFFAGVLPTIVGHPMAHFAVQGAALDGRLVESATSLAAAVGAARTALPRTQVLGRQSSVEALSQRVDLSAALVKVKIQAGWDIEPLRALREGFPQLALAADANGAYTRSSGPWAALDELDLTYLEQPLGACDLLGHAELARVLRTPIALDESIRDPGDVALAKHLGAAAIVNLKPGRLGGFCSFLAASDNGLQGFVGGMYELGIARATTVALAAREECCLPTDLGPSDQYVATDITDPIECDSEGRLRVPNGPGIGVAVRREVLRAASVRPPLDLLNPGRLR